MLPIILIANEESSKKKFIDKFVRENNINPSNITIVSPVKTELGIDQIRSLKKDLIMSPSSRRLIILENLDNSGIEVQNSLLKTLEEKYQSNQFIIPVQNLAKILPTIQSRSKIVNLNKDFKTQVSPKSANILKAAETDNTGKVLAGVDTQTFSREEAIIFMNEIIFYYREKLATDTIKASQVLRKVLKTKELYENNNLNTQLALDGILIFINKTYSSAL